MLLIFGSATTAKRVEKTAAKYGVLATVIHTPKSISKSGCSHAVKIDEKDYKTVIYGNARSILDEVKNEVKPLTYNKIENLYERFKNRI